jgi:DNA-binding response OmpR family regulator
MRKRVMLIQDNDECADIMRLILEEEGLEVVSMTGKAPLTRPENFNLLIIDEFSAGKTGCDICKNLKTGYPNFNSPIVLTSTGIGLESFKPNCEADYYLSKPFDIFYFVELVKCLLDKQPVAYQHN